LAGLTLSYLGDGANNMAHSYLLAGPTPGCTSGSAPRTGCRPIRRSSRGRRTLAGTTGGSVAVTMIR
jgi:ornithine carbamoyltransferase